MSDLERDVARHYSRGSLKQGILDALRAGGKDPDHLTAADLSGADEFHLGWYATTAELIRDMAFSADMSVLEVGSGIGGPARHIAEASGCRVTGIDLTTEFVDVATDLTRRCGLADRVAFRQGSALAMPFAAASFDAATLIHVGMNIADKLSLFREVRRVLKPGGRFCVYDIMRIAEGIIPYPMPWAETADISFVETPARYRELLDQAGFAVAMEKSRRELALRLSREMKEKVAVEGLPPLNMHVLIGPAAPQRMGNVLATLAEGTIAPVEFIAEVTLDK